LSPGRIVGALPHALKNLFAGAFQVVASDEELFSTGVEWSFDQENIDS
jgi:hypothetical protein